MGSRASGMGRSLGVQSLGTMGQEPDSATSRLPRFIRQWGPRQQFLFTILLFGASCAAGFFSVIYPVIAIKGALAVSCVLCLAAGLLLVWDVAPWSSRARGGTVLFGAILGFVFVALFVRSIVAGNAVQNPSSDSVGVRIVATNYEIDKVSEQEYDYQMVFHVYVSNDGAAATVKPFFGMGASRTADPMKMQQNFNWAISAGSRYDKGGPGQVFLVYEHAQNSLLTIRPWQLLTHWGADRVRAGNSTIYLYGTLLSRVGEAEKATPFCLYTQASMLDVCPSEN